nr:hypothetical protein GCM10010200_001850 [Actinomadura rugatobispora]
MNATTPTESSLRAKVSSLRDREVRSRITRAESRRQAKGTVLQDLRVADAGSERRRCLQPCKKRSSSTVR